jgi:hypothetical protein
MGVASQPSQKQNNDGATKAGASLKQNTDEGAAATRALPKLGKEANNSDEGATKTASALDNHCSTPNASKADYCTHTGHRVMAWCFQKSQEVKKDSVARLCAEHATQLLAYYRMRTTKRYH